MSTSSTTTTMTTNALSARVFAIDLVLAGVSSYLEFHTLASGFARMTHAAARAAKRYAACDAESCWELARKEGWLNITSACVHEALACELTLFPFQTVRCVDWASLGHLSLLRIFSERGPVVFPCLEVWSMRVFGDHLTEGLAFLDSLLQSRRIVLPKLQFISCPTQKLWARPVPSSESVDTIISSAPLPAVLQPAVVYHRAFLNHAADDVPIYMLDRLESVSLELESAACLEQSRVTLQHIAIGQASEWTAWPSGRGGGGGGAEWPKLKTLRQVNLPFAEPLRAPRLVTLVAKIRDWDRDTRWTVPSMIPESLDALTTLSLTFRANYNVAWLSHAKLRAFERMCALEQFAAVTHLELTYSTWMQCEIVAMPPNLRRLRLSTMSTPELRLGFLEACERRERGKRALDPLLSFKGKEVTCAHLTELELDDCYHAVLGLRAPQLATVRFGLWGFAGSKLSRPTYPFARSVAAWLAHHTTCEKLVSVCIGAYELPEWTLPFATHWQPGAWSRTVNRFAEQIKRAPRVQDVLAANHEDAGWFGVWLTNLLPRVVRCEVAPRARPQLNSYERSSSFGDDGQEEAGGELFA